MNAAVHTTGKRTIHRQILAIAFPAIVSNITVPLLGLIDVAIVGHLGSAAYIGAIAVGGMLFNVLYWLLGFLRMGTSGLVSQAYGQGNREETARLLYRAVGIGVLLAVALLATQWPVRQAAFLLIQPGEEVGQWAACYFHICIWGAPAVLSLYGLTGWFIGMQNARAPMIVALVQNIVNIAASLSFVYLLDMKVEGVAAGTVIAQYAGLGAAIWMCQHTYRGHLNPGERRSIFRREALKRFFQVNRDIFLRTLCLVAVTLYFTAAGASEGEVVLAVNTLLMQLFTLFSYVMDGFAYAGEALTGKFIGAGDRQQLRQTVRGLFTWGTSIATLFTLLYGVGGDEFLGLLTNEPGVIAASTDYFPWAVLIPIAGFSAFLWDGVYVGATATRQMLASMAAAAGTFFAVYLALRPALGNHALWLAFLCYLTLRGVMQWILRRYIPALKYDATSYTRK